MPTIARFKPRGSSETVVLGAVSSMSEEIGTQRVWYESPVLVWSGALSEGASPTFTIDAAAVGDRRLAATVANEGVGGVNLAGAYAKHMDLDSDDIFSPTQAVVDANLIDEITSASQQLVDVDAIDRDVGDVTFVDSSPSGPDEVMLEQGAGGAITVTASPDLSGAALALALPMRLDPLLDALPFLPSEDPESADPPIQVSITQPDAGAKDVLVNEKGEITLDDGVCPIRYDGVISGRSMVAAPVLPQSLIDDGAVQPSDGHALAVRLVRRIPERQTARLPLPEGGLPLRPDFLRPGSSGRLEEVSIDGGALTLRIVDGDGYPADLTAHWRHGWEARLVRTSGESVTIRRQDVTQDGNDPHRWLLTAAKIAEIGGDGYNGDGVRIDLSNGPLPALDHGVQLRSESGDPAAGVSLTEVVRFIVFDSRTGDAGLNRPDR